MTGNGHLPFPFNLDYYWRIIIIIIMTSFLLYGIRLRLLIYGYLKEPDTKMGAINLLIWIDQVFRQVFISNKLILF